MYKFEYSGTRGESINYTISSNSTSYAAFLAPYAEESTHASEGQLEATESQWI